MPRAALAYTGRGGQDFRLYTIIVFCILFAGFSVLLPHVHTFIPFFSQHIK